MEPYGIVTMTHLVQTTLYYLKQLLVHHRQAEIKTVNKGVTDFCGATVCKAITASVLPNLSSGKLRRLA
jgi:hypothetical protein